LMQASLATLLASHPFLLALICYLMPYKYNKINRL
jgi:hypothetical protein